MFTWQIVDSLHADLTPTYIVLTCISMFGIFYVADRLAHKRPD